MGKSSSFSVYWFDCSLIDDNIEENNRNLELHSSERDQTVGEISNWVHDSVPVSNDEVRTILINVKKLT